MKLCYIFLLLLVQRASAQVTPVGIGAKIYLSAHTPMWTATIDLKTKTFISITDEGKQISKKIDVVNSKNSGVLIKSKDRKVSIRLYQTKNCECPYDIPEKEASQWNAEIQLNKKRILACAYWE